MKRLIWASTRERILHGTRHVARKSPEAVAVLGPDAKGVVTAFAEVDLDAALAAYDQVATERGHFSLETAENTRIDFLFVGRFREFVAYSLLRRRNRLPVTLDIWFANEPDPHLDDVVGLSPADAREVVARAFCESTDEAIWSFIRRSRI